MNARRVHYCRACRRETTQRFLFSENGRRPKVETYTCERCGLLLLTMGDVPDAEGLCLFIVQERFRIRRAAGTSSGDGGNTPTGRAGDAHHLSTRSDDRWLDYEDAVGHLREQIVLLWTRFDPTRGVPFRAYAVGELRNDLTDWMRTQVGRDRPKPFANALSLDGLADDPGDLEGDGPDRGCLLEALVGGSLDDDSDSLADLRRVLVRRDRELAELDRRRGVRSDA